MRTLLLAVSILFVEGASPPSTCPTLTVDVTTAPTYNETQYSIDSDLSPSLLSNGKDADEVTGTQLTTFGFGAMYALDGSGAGGGYSSPNQVSSQMSSSSASTSTQFSTSTSTSTSESADEDNSLHVAKKFKTEEMNCDECGKGDIIRETNFDTKSALTNTGISDCHPANNTPGDIDPNSVAHDVLQAYGNVVAIDLSDQCLIVDARSSKFQNVIKEAIEMDSVDHKVVYHCVQDEIHDEKDGRCTKSRSTFENRPGYADEERVCFNTFDLDRTTAEQRRPLDDEFERLQERHDLLKIGDVETIDIDDVISMENESGVQYNYNIRLDIINGHNGPFVGGKRLRGFGVGHVLDTVESGVQVSLGGNPQHGRNGAKHEGLVTGQNGYYPWIKNMIDGVDDGFHGIDNDIAVFTEKLDGLLVTADPRTANSLEEVTFMESVVPHTASWAPDYQVDLHDLPEDDDTNTFDVDYSYLEDDHNADLEAGASPTSSGSTSSSTSPHYAGTMTEIQSDKMYNTRNSRGTKWVDPYPRQVDVNDAAKEYTPAEDRAAFKYMDDSVITHRDHVDPDPYTTVRIMNVNENQLALRQTEFDNALEWLTSEKIGYAVMHTVGHVTALCKFVYIYYIYLYSTYLINYNLTHLLCSVKNYFVFCSLF